MGLHRHLCSSEQFGSSQVFQSVYFRVASCTVFESEILFSVLVLCSVTF